MSDDPSPQHRSITPPVVDGVFWPEGANHEDALCLSDCQPSVRFAVVRVGPVAYCSALAGKYSGFLAATNRQRSQDPQTVSARAGMEQCQAGNTAVGIPVLESGLRNAGLDLPPRDSTWTFIGVKQGSRR